MRDRGLLDIGLAPVVCLLGNLPQHHHKVLPVFAIPGVVEDLLLDVLQHPWLLDDVLPEVLDRVLLGVPLVQGVRMVLVLPTHLVGVGQHPVDGDLVGTAGRPLGRL